ncbi:MAG: GNAT family N-acetyltransferase [Oscillospiraceae bacterium]|nr:GNAT family N-acetyltransferase [Oscillospiraceae bacterium]
MNQESQGELYPLHCTELGLQRINRNLLIPEKDVIEWCSHAIEQADMIMELGKNRYVYKEGIVITINRHSNTIITAKKIHPVIRVMQEPEYVCLREFLYQAIYIPKSIEPPDRTIVDKPELQLYIKDFGSMPGDLAVTAVQNSQICGAAWTRIIEGYGHINDSIPELAISVFPEFRGVSIGTRLMKKLFSILKLDGYTAVSLSVDKASPAVRFYKKLGFEVYDEKQSMSDFIMIKYLR